MSYKNILCRYKFVRLLSVVTLTFLSCISTAETIRAPFGLTWGESRGEIESTGAILKGCLREPSNPFNDGLSVKCFMENPPKPVSFGGSYLLYFHDVDGLNKVVLKKPINSDPHGMAGKKLYSKIKNILNSRYDRVAGVNEFEGKDGSSLLYKFYECMWVGPSCGRWYTGWADESVVVMLELKGNHNNEGYLSLLYASSHKNVSQHKEIKLTPSDAGSL